jgi:hypothetical protein
MKINPLDAHDRLLHVNKTESSEIDDCCQDLIKKKPFGDHPFYIFVHPRTDDDGANKRLIWQDRISRPSPQTNSMLFKAYPSTNTVKIIWIIPPREMWAQYKIGCLTASQMILDSIYLFENSRDQLEAPEEDDPPPHVAQELMFEYKPWLFKRDTLPLGKRAIWDQKMKERQTKGAL